MNCTACFKPILVAVRPPTTHDACLARAISLAVRRGDVALARKLRDRLRKRRTRGITPVMGIRPMPAKSPETCRHCARSHSTEADQRQCDERARRAARDVAMRGGR